MARKLSAKINRKSLVQPNIFRLIRRRLTTRRLIILGIVIVLALAVRLLTAPKPLVVSISQVSSGDLTESISASGSISGDEITLVFPTLGKVSWVGVTEGQRVAKWQGIAALDKTLLDVAYQQARSNLRAADATLERIYDSVKGHDVGESFIDKDTRTQAEVAKNNAFDAVRAAKYNLENATLIAPFAGVIVKADPAFAGVNLTPNSSYVLVNPDSFYFSAQVNEIDVAKIQPGQKVTVTLDAYPEKKLESRVKLISLTPSLTSTGGTAYKVKIIISQTEKLNLRLGMNGDAEFVLNKIEKVLLVPSTAVVEEKDRTFVFSVLDDRVSKTEVKTGASSVDFVQIIEGLSPGENIVTNPPAGIKDGDRIKIS